MSHDADIDRGPATADALAAAIERVRLTPERIAERQARTLAAIGGRATPPSGNERTRWLLEPWPGDETDEQLQAAERMLDDEDAGRPRPRVPARAHSSTDSGRQSELKGRPRRKP